MNGFRTCTVCGETLPATTEFFSTCRLSPDGLRSWCKVCAAEAQRQYRLAHMEQEKAYRMSHHEKRRTSGHAYHQQHRTQARKYHATYRQRHRAEINEVQREARRKDQRARLDHGSTNALWWSLRHGRKHGSWAEFFPFSFAELKAHLENRFRDGMSWANYGEWEIDHIRPRSAFRFTSPQDLGFKECWRLENLQPLWAEENLLKGSRMEAVTNG